MEVGEVSTLTKTEDLVAHMEVDLADQSRLLYADSYTLISTNGITSDIISGSPINPPQSYVEGELLQARFAYIRGFVQLNSIS